MTLFYFVKKCTVLKIKKEITNLSIIYLMKGILIFFQKGGILTHIFSLRKESDMKNKLETISNLFEGKEIRSIWNNAKEDYYFSVVDVIAVLTNSKTPKRYWSDLKSKLINEGSQLYDFIVQLKLKSSKDNKLYLTDTLDTKGIFRLIESIPSPKAEPFKLWLANLGSDRIDEVFDPAIAIERSIKYYLNKGYTMDWINKRIQAILHRNELTNYWSENGITNEEEYALLTNKIYKTWSGMNVKEYKNYKGLRKENLRDNMTDIEIALTDLSEIATKNIAIEKQPHGFTENKIVAKLGGTVAKVAKNELQKNVKEVISNKNSLNYKYMDSKKRNDEESSRN